MSIQGQAAEKLNPGESRPRWWSEDHDKLLKTILDNKYVRSFDVTRFKATMGVEFEETMPNFGIEQQYDFDVDFVISRTEYVKEESHQNAKKRILNDRYTQFDIERMPLEAICEKCVYPHNVYVGIQRHPGSKNLSYGETRAGCCGRTKVTMLVVIPLTGMQDYFLGVGQSPVAESLPNNWQTTSRDAEIKEMSGTRHEAFLGRHHLICHPPDLEYASSEERTSISRHEVRLDLEMVKNGGTLMLTVEKLLNPEIYTHSIKSLIEYALGLRIEQAISSQANTAGEEESKDQDETPVEEESDDSDDQDELRSLPLEKD